MKFIVASSFMGPPDRRTAEVELPDGYYRVLSGAVKPGDVYLNSSLFWHDGIEEWLEVSFPLHSREDGIAMSYLCLARQGEPVDRECPRCHEKPLRPGWKYCTCCAFDLVRERRRAERP